MGLPGTGLTKTQPLPARRVEVSPAPPRQAGGSEAPASLNRQRPALDSGRLRQTAFFLVLKVLGRP